MNNETQNDKVTFKQKVSNFWNKLTIKDVSFTTEDGTLKTIKKKRSMVIPGLILFIIFFMLCFSFVATKRKLKWDQFGILFSQLFVPSKWSLKTHEGYKDFVFNTAIPRIWDTVQMVYIATILGVLLSVPLYILSASNVVEKKRIFIPVRIIVNFFRTIPTFVLAIIGTVFFGFSDTAGIFAMSLFTAGVMYKLMYEYIETVDMGPFEASVSSGANRLKGYSIAIHPQIMPMFVSNIIYIFEINIRASVVLGFVGAGGIGQLLSNALESSQYDKVGAILIPLFIVVFVLQVISSMLRRRSN
ncbi:MAG: phosphonate ABC transporter, permease protein PhnE [Acholeplasmatales bacterium]|nr:phosphonate ABC transporter, permease protein PhnE [Acholeplasmatales bacterium]